MTPKINKSIDFEFCYTIPKGKDVKVVIPLTIPIKGLSSDLAEVHIREHRIPCFAEDRFRETFLSFISEEHDKILQEAGDASVAELDLKVDEDAEIWISEYTRASAPSSKHLIKQEEEFGQICHYLHHSPALPAMRAEEHKAAQELRVLVKRRNEEIRRIQDHHVMAMEGYISNGSHVDTNAVNDLAASQLDQRQECEVKWASEISHLIDQQRKSFTAWVLQTYEASLGGQDIATVAPFYDSYPTEEQPEQKLEESFSICIGSQLKMTHSIRLFVDDVWGLCKSNPASPERLQTALSLYTTSLSGLILLVDNRLNLYTGNTQKLSKICEISPEFHFAPFDQQLSAIRQKILNPDVTRKRTPTDYLIDETVPSSRVTEDTETGDLVLPTGTCYITRHSNLKQVHTVFHLASTLNEIQNDISSRDSLLIGLKSALKIATENNVDNMIVPLFLTHVLDSKMDHNWCVKRAEVVFKCVKGFLIEIGSNGTLTSKTFHFILPKNTTQRTFQAISSLLPSIFRVPCPMVLDQGSRRKTLDVKELCRFNLSNSK